MTNLLSTPDSRLIQIHNNLYGDSSSFESFLEENKGNKIQAKKDIIDSIKSALHENNYDGGDNSEAIYWFSRGISNKLRRNANRYQNREIPLIQLPPPPPPPREPERYIDSDVGLFNNIQNLLKSQRKATDDSALHTKFHRWKKLETKQDKLVEEIMTNLYKNPDNWEINFEQLNNQGRTLLCPKLAKFFDDVVSHHEMNRQYLISYCVNRQWHTMPLIPENYNQLRQNLTRSNFIFSIDKTPAEFFYDKGAQKVPAWSLFSGIRFYRNPRVDTYSDRGGEFFSYLVKEQVPQCIKDYLIKLQIFDKLTDDRNKFKQRSELNDCCFVYALSQTDDYSIEELNQIRLRIQNRYLSQNAINQLCSEFKIHLKLTFIDEDFEGRNKKQTVKPYSNSKRKNYLGVEKDEANHIHHFNIFQKHYFIEEKTPFSTYYMKNYEEINDETKFDKEYVLTSKHNNQRYWRKSKYFISSSNLVRLLFKKNLFKPITYGEYSILNTIYYNEIENDVSNIKLEFDKNFCTQLIEPKKYKEPKKKFYQTYWYCDFEADVSGKIHRPYMCVIQNENGTVNKTFRGKNCNIKLLEFLPDESIIYFHNLSYDIRMLASFGIQKSIIKGTKTMMTDINFKGKILHFKDTLPILNCKLEKLPKMFNLTSELGEIKKEIFPYKYYTLDRLIYNRGKISEAGQNEDKKWSNEDYLNFVRNIDSIPGCRINNFEFDMYKYSQFYCEQDVNILRLGFNKFRKGFLDDFKIDPFKFISISSLANEVFNRKVYYGKNLYKIGGVVRKFCSHAIYGGRCMTAYNKKWHTMINLTDFDAKSLYPSAMRRLYTVEGIPQVISPDQLNIEFLSKQGAYIVEIEISKVNKHYAFPLIVRKVNGINLNDDKLKEGEKIKMIVDNIYLEDLIEFQKIEYKILRGYYWSGKRDYTIQEEIQKIFDKRTEYQKEKNPLQELYKLIMNSCYGKTIERPVEKDWKYLKKGDELNKFWTKNYNKIVESIELNDSEISAVKTLKPIDKHFNFSLLGIQVLSMSKRIMNEVMCLAFDKGCHIYYVDTDSFMIECPDLVKLEVEYEKKYNRKLIGNNLGQFHCDFPSIKDHDEMPWSIEAYFLMKKMYIHKITDSTNEIDYVIRGKGITLNSIYHAANSKFKGDLMKLYEYLFNGKSIQFDLTQGQPCFSMNKDMTVSTLNEFFRKIKTNYEEGKREKYFEYSK